MSEFSNTDPMFDEQVLSRLFCSDPHVTDQIGLICGSLGDPEAIEETRAFLGLKSTQVTPDTWRRRFTAVAFFSDFAFYYFVPSIIRCAHLNPLSTHLAVEQLILSLLPVSSPWLRDKYKRRWRQFNSKQLDYLAAWMRSFEAELMAYFSDEEVQAASKVLMQYAEDARDIEHLHNNP